MGGKLILVVGPTGSGKGTLLSFLRAQDASVVFPVSYTTRPPRPGEKDGEKYFFIGKKEFEEREAAGEFLEWAAYGGNYYGTLKAQVLPALAAGKTVVREVEVQGARVLKRLLGPRLHIIYIDAGSWEDLERRVRARAPIGEAELLARRKRFEDEITFKAEADAVVRNPDGGLEQAKRDFLDAVRHLSAGSVQ